jgi:DNA modification methylase
VIDQVITDRYAIYNGDCCEVLPDLKGESVGLVVYSPPFADLYNYSSSERDLSNCKDYEQFLQHYGFVVRETARLLMPGRVACVHCCDIPIPGQRDGYRDFPGDIIRLHQEAGFKYQGRVCIWKEPLRVALRTRLQHLTHRNLVKDSTLSYPAGGDYVLLFKKRGENPQPVAHPTGLSSYAGERPIPMELLEQRAHLLDDGDGTIPQQKNRLSQWIWRNYASCFWDDIRIDRVLPYKKARETEEEKHVCPLQLDTIERCVAMWSNPGDVVLTPFLGVGSEVYTAVRMGRRGVGSELKSSYFRQAVANIADADKPLQEAATLFDDLPEDAEHELEDAA